MEETLIFRAPGDLAAAIQRGAEEAGLNVSQYLRAIIGERLNVAKCSSPVCEHLARAAFFEGEHSAFAGAQRGITLHEGKADPDPLALIVSAGVGDRQAQRDMADLVLLRVLSGSHLDPFLVLSEGLIFARMADRGDDIDDTMRVVTMLALASTLGTGIAACDMAAEVIARLELIANGDSELANDAADLLASCAEHESVETMEVAQEYRDRLSAKEPA